jgi:hypothetical protein
VPAYPQPPIANIVKMKTAHAISPCNASENSAALGRALHRDVSLHRSLVPKMFIAANNKRTQCAKAAQDWYSGNHCSDTRPAAEYHRQTPQSVMVNSSCGAFLQVEMRQTQENSVAAQNRSVPHWHRFAVADSDLGERRPERVPWPRKSRDECLFRRRRASESARAPLFCVSASPGSLNHQVACHPERSPALFLSRPVPRSRDRTGAGRSKGSAFLEPESSQPSG